jgi:hypothetical protein
MRTTLTLDDDVAVQLEDLRRKRDLTFKDVVNDALRRGLRDLQSGGKPTQKPFKTKVYDLGRARFPIDNIAEALAFAEGEDHK